MKKFLSLAVCLIFKLNIEAVVISGFGQVRYDSSDGFSIPKVQIFLKVPLEIGVAGVNVRYETYADFGNTGQVQLILANLIFKFKKRWLPEVVVGRTPDALTYQFPSIPELPVIIFPAALLNSPHGTGIYAKGNYNNLWATIGLINGTSGYKDDNNSLDVTG